MCCTVERCYLHWWLVQLTNSRTQISLVYTSWIDHGRSGYDISGLYFMPSSWEWCHKSCWFIHMFAFKLKLYCNPWDKKDTQYTVNPLLIPFSNKPPPSFFGARNLLSPPPLPPSTKRRNEKQYYRGIFAVSVKHKSTYSTHMWEILVDLLRKSCNCGSHGHNTSLFW